MKATLGMKLIFGLFFGFMLAGTALADTVWTYTGNSISYLGFNPGPGGVAPPLDIGVNPCNCALDGTVTLDANSHAIAWSFTDGTDILTNFNSSGFINPFACFGCSGSDPSSLDSVPFEFWKLSLAGGGVTMSSMFNGSFGDAQDSASSPTVLLSVESNPGTWTELVSTPEPATGLLVGLALVFAGLMHRRRKKPADPTLWESLG